MHNNVSQETMDSSARLFRVQADLNEALENFPNQSIGLKKLSNAMMLSERTLKRILKGSHSPTYQTILKVYRYLTATNNDRETILKMPELLAKCVNQTNENFAVGKNTANFSAEIDFYLKSDSVFRSIYAESATGNLHRDKVGFEHGQHGLKTLDYMLKLDVIQEIEPNIYTSSSNRASLDNESLHHLARFFLDNKFSTEKCNLSGENFFQVVFDGIDTETYNELLKIDWRAKNERIEILKNAKPGNVKFWTISFTDTLSESCIYDENKEVLQ